jgi:hypothetical protein
MDNLTEASPPVRLLVLATLLAQMKAAEQVGQMKREDRERFARIEGLLERLVQGLPVPPFVTGGTLPHSRAEASADA